MKGFVVCMAVLAGCWWGTPPAPPPTATATARANPRVGAEEIGGADPLTFIDPEPAPGSPYPRCAPFDPANPTCRDACRKRGLDDSCGTCPSPPDPNIEACRRSMPCPVPPDRRILACQRMAARARARQCGRIMTRAVTPDAVLLLINLGASAGITTAWTAEICDANRQGIPGGDVQLVRVDRQVLVVRTTLAPDLLDEWVCLEPP